MGHIGFKVWALTHLQAIYPKGTTPTQLAEFALEAGIPSTAKKQVQSLASTARRWTRPGDDFNDPRFGERREAGKLVIFAYGPGSSANGSLGSSNEIGASDLAKLLVEYGAYPHAVEALEALGNLSVRGHAVPSEKMNALREAIVEERKLNERKRVLIEQIESFVKGNER